MGGLPWPLALGLTPPAAGWLWCGDVNAAGSAGAGDGRNGTGPSPRSSMKFVSLDSCADMEFLEVLTERLDRVLLVRGGGREVITIYS